MLQGCLRLSWDVVTIQAQLDQPVGVLVEGTWRVGRYVGDLSLRDVDFEGGLSVLSKPKVISALSVFSALMGSTSGMASL